MEEKNVYVTVEREASAEFEEKRSRFIGYAAPCPDEESALAFVQKIKQKHADATHNVYAYRIDGGIYARYSDDGEPQGTAGIPVLEVLRKSGADHVCVVVTRYFGGTLLGAGGLVRAYSTAAKMALDAARPVTYEKYIEMRFRCSYAEYGKITPALEKFGAIVDGADFEEVVCVRFALLHTKADEFAALLGELSAGRCELVRTGERFDFRKKE